MSAASISRPRAGAGSRPKPAPGRPRSRADSPARAGIRWDRLGRLAMLSVIAVLLYLYLSGGIRMLSTWKQARADRSAVTALAHEHQALVHEHEALSRRGTVEGDARRLGMMKKGEQQYIVSGLPDN